METKARHGAYCRFGGTFLTFGVTDSIFPMQPPQFADYGQVAVVAYCAIWSFWIFCDCELVSI